MNFLSLYYRYKFLLGICDISVSRFFSFIGSIIFHWKDELYRGNTVRVSLSPVPGSRIARRTRRTITCSRSSRRIWTRRWSVTRFSVPREKWRKPWRWLSHRLSTPLIRRGSCRSPIPGFITRRIRVHLWRPIKAVRRLLHSLNLNYELNSIEPFDKVKVRVR